MSIRLFFTGDVVLFNKWQGKLFGQKLHDTISNADLVCCNFEAPITCDRQKKATKIGPSISQNRECINSLKQEGVTLLSLANNHIMDYGFEGLKATIEYCQNNKVNHIGAGFSSEEIYKPFILEKDDVKVGLISVAENGFGTSLREDVGGYAWFGSNRFNEELQKIIISCDYVFVICHGGAEKWDIPLPEYRDLYRSWIDQGVNGVIAHHPHVPQGFESYRDGGIYYSLGNFAFNKGFGIQNPKTICAEIIIDDNKVYFSSIPTVFTEQGVDVCEDLDFAEHIKICNQMLLEPNYTKAVNETVLKAFNEKYKRYFGCVLNRYSGGIKQLFKTVLYRIVEGKKFSNEWLYHNLIIETHYWICRRAVDLLINSERSGEKA